MKQLIHNALEPWPIKDRSVQAVITSPPYYKKRRYKIPDISVNGWAGQYGIEDTLERYIEHSMLWISEAKRVLRETGLLLINIGDTYHKGGQLCIPEQLKVACVKDGWRCINTIVWHKSNGLPGSMKNRFITRHEFIYIMARSPRHFFNLDAVRVPYKPDSINRCNRAYNKSGVPDEATHDGRGVICKSYEVNPLGANPGDVWTISTGKNINYGHYAGYPEELAERMVKCSSSPDDIILDPFMGTGTTLKVADSLGRQTYGFDLGYQKARDMKLKEIQKKIVL